jgi:hypothetical protein
MGFDSFRFVFIFLFDFVAPKLAAQYPRQALAKKFSLRPAPPEIHFDHQDAIFPPWRMSSFKGL